MKKGYKMALKEVDEMALRAMASKGKKPAPRPTPPEVEAGENDYPHGVQGPAQGEVAGLKTGEDQGIESPKMEDFAALIDKHSPDEHRRLVEMYSKIKGMKSAVRMKG